MSEQFYKPLPFRLYVKQYICGDCDLIFLVEVHNDLSNSILCPHCGGHEDVEYKHTFDLKEVQ